MATRKRVRCSFCRIIFLKDIQRINESKKKGWAFFCSSACVFSSRKTGHLLTCGRQGCNKKFWRTKYQYKLCHGHYCSRSCAVAVNNSKKPKRQAVVKHCAYCGKDFKTLEKYCSLECQRKNQVIPPNKLVGIIKEFYNENGRIPLKKEFHHYHAIRGRFGTWNNAIKAAGFEPNPILFAKKYIAKDGHKCDSLTEKIIDDWLSAKKIEHKRNVRYPGKQSFTVDFMVKGYWIEFFGLAGELKTYDELRKKKLKLIKKYHLPHIALYPSDIFPKNKLDSILSFL